MTNSVLERSDELYEAYSKASRYYKSLEGVGTGQFGSTPDYVRSTSEYKIRRDAMLDAFAALRRFNGQNMIELNRLRKEAKREPL